MIINKEELFKHYDGDEDILLEIVEIFINQKDSEMNKLKKAIENKDAKEITLVSHTLKGIVSNFYAEELRVQFFDLEQKGKKNSLDNVDSDFLELEKIFPQFVLEIEELKSEIQKRL